MLALGTTGSRFAKRRAIAHEVETTIKEDRGESGDLGYGQNAAAVY